MGGRKDTGALLALFICGLGFGSTPLWVLLSGWNDVGTVCARAFGAGLFMLVIFLPRLKRALRLLLTSWKPCLVAGLWASASTTTFAWAFFLVKAPVVYTSYYTFPVVCLAYDVFFLKRRPTRLEVGGLALALIGLVVAMGEDLKAGSLGWGAVLAIVSSLTWAAHIYAAKPLKTSDESLAALILGQFAAALVLAVVFVFRLQDVAVAMPSTMQMFWLGILGLAAATAVFCWGLGVRQIPGSVAGAITMIEAPIGVLLVAALGQAVSMRQIFGGILILIAAVTLVLKRKE